MQNPLQAVKTLSLTLAGCRSGLGQAKLKRGREKYQQQVFTCIFDASNIHGPPKMPQNESSGKAQHGGDQGAPAPAGDAKMLLKNTHNPSQKVCTQVPSFP